MRITSKGQVTIPADIRERAGLLPHTEVDFEFDGKVVRIVRTDARGKRRSRRALGRSFAGTRRCRPEHRCHHGFDPR